MKIKLIMFVDDNGVKVDIYSYVYLPEPDLQLVPAGYHDPRIRRPGTRCPEEDDDL